ncbi:VWA domain-containing protein [Silvibacterium dinghuense]|uniref:VWA domain-containing protein n=2 Tax=Silvibacterium dinghuense TaxID=1560006 RepID=A0A4Q1SKC1_9BACT|nr:VWA domain-containing protein [Silvibacterium dinghuense]
MSAFAPALAQDQLKQSPEQSSFTLKVTSDLVLTNVVVRDKKTGDIVHGLTSKDFTVLENGKPQSIASFDFESVDQAAPLNEATISGSSGKSLFNAKTGVAKPEELRNHRLIVLFFDLTSMQPEDIERSVEAARDYINKQMAPADLVSVVSLDTNLSLDQDFTQNKQLLLNAVNNYDPGAGQGFQPGATSTTNQVEDTTAFTADESEYNDLNTDRELFAISSIAKSLAYINEKKSMLYFSGGIQRDGIENQASLRSAINSAVRSNLSIYSVDTRGLQAISPLGDASTGSLRGTSSYNGAGLQNNMDSNYNTQEVMATLSSDTGGKAFFDSNDFSPAFERVQRDTSAYYVIGFRSTDTRKDGRYRRLTIKVNRPDVKLEYRPGYYAPADFLHSNREDRERQLEDELASDLPATDVAVYLQALYFRTDETHYFVPVSLVVPGSQIPFVKGGDKDKATLDIIGEVKEASGRSIGQARQTVKLSIDQAQQVRQKNVQYSTGFTLPIGKYHLKFVVRENETGRMGSFEADIQVPDQRRIPLKMSSVVLASQMIPAPKNSDNPLDRDGQQLVPNLPHVFRQDQHLYFLYEVYAPSHVGTASSDPKAAKEAEKNPKAPVKVLTSIEFLKDGAKSFETPLVEASSVNVPNRDAVAFQFDVPLNGLKPGLYTCQVNVIDDAGGSFSFPRTAVLIREPAPAPTTPAAPAQGGTPTPSSPGN